MLIGKTETSSCSNPVLQFVAAKEGKMVDLDSLEFEVWDTSDEAKRLAPVQVGIRTVVNLADCPTGDRVGLGRYAAVFDASTTANRGRHELRWFWKYTAASAEETSVQPFDVVERRLFGDQPMYVLPSEIRDEGYAQDFVTDVRLQQAIALASTIVDRVTGRFFEPRYMTTNPARFDGGGSRAVLFGDPIIAVESVKADSDPANVADLAIDSNNYRVYNRHLTSRITNPDDRNDPKIEFVHSLDLFGVSSRARFMPLQGYSLRSFAFPVGVQNIAVAGVFGYTEWDGSPLGRTPLAIVQATKLLVARELPELADPACRSQVQNGWRVIEARVRDQTMRYSNPVDWGGYTGDPTIDMLLTMHMRPMQIGSV